MNKVNTRAKPSEHGTPQTGESASDFVDGRGDEQICSNCHEDEDGPNTLRKITLLPPWLGGSPTDSNTAYLCPSCYDRYENPRSSEYDANSRPSDWDKRRRLCYKADAHDCVCCSRDVGKMTQRSPHAHHIVPVSSGGTHRLSNTRTVCKACHDLIHSHVLTPVQASEALYRLVLKFIPVADEAMGVVAACRRFSSRLANEATSGNEGYERRRVWASLYRDCQQAIVAIDEFCGQTNSAWVSPRIVQSVKSILQSHRQQVRSHLRWLDTLRDELSLA